MKGSGTNVLQICMFCRYYGQKPAHTKGQSAGYCKKAGYKERKGNGGYLAADGNYYTEVGKASWCYGWERRRQP